MSMTFEEYLCIRQRRERLAKIDWQVSLGNAPGFPVVACYSREAHGVGPDDAVFFQRAPADVDALLREVERLRAELRVLARSTLGRAAETSRCFVGVCRKCGQEVEYLAREREPDALLCGNCSWEKLNESHVSRSVIVESDPSRGPLGNPQGVSLEDKDSSLWNPKLVPEACIKSTPRPEEGPAPIPSRLWLSELDKGEQVSFAAPGVVADPQSDILVQQGSPRGDG